MAAGLRRAPRQLLQLYGEAPLRPVCGARFLRRSVMLRLADGSRAELACDCGVLHGKTEELPFAEVELESKEGAPDAAKALAGRLAKQYNLRWEPLSKFACANALKSTKCRELSPRHRVISAEYAADLLTSSIRP